MSLINNLTTEEYHKGALFALENAERHLVVANEIAEKQNFGMAISHLILSLEELSKAVILKIKSNGEGIRIRNFDDYFRNHKIKHWTTIRLFSILLLKDISMEELESKTMISKGEIATFVLLIFVFIAVAVIGYDIIDKEIKEIPEKLNEMRNRGFYVDYNIIEKKWSTPLTVHTEKEWTETQNITIEMIEFIKRGLFSNNINKNDIKKFIKQLADENIITPDLKGDLREIEETLE